MRLEFNSSARTPSSTVARFLVGAKLDEIRHAGCSGPGGWLREKLNISPNNALEPPQYYYDVLGPEEKITATQPESDHTVNTTSFRMC